MAYPDDENGDVLRRMEAAGDDLARPRDVDFTVVFPTGGAADQFAQQFRSLGHIASIEFAEVVEHLSWEVVVVKHMELSHSEIGDFEDTLQSAAEPLGGRNDGWGCLSEPSSPSTARTA
jgi:hypothetical protein